MPIEFDCPQCHHRLRTPDGSEGKTALCPNCSGQVTIPAASSDGADADLQPAPQAAPYPGATDAAFNPYASPSSSTVVPPMAGEFGDLTHTSVSVGDVLSTTWQVFRNNLVHFLLLGLILIAMYIGGSVVSAPLSFLSGMAGQQQNVALLITVNVVNIVWGQIYGTFCVAVGIKYTLEVVNGNTEPFNNAFKVWSVFWRVLFVQLICALLAGSGAFVCVIPLIPFVVFADGDPAIIVPAVIVFSLLAITVYMLIWTRICLAIPFVVDRRQGISEAISSSAAFTKGNALAIFAAFVVVWIALFFFMIFTCFLGSVFAMPYGLLMIVVIYRMVTGQPVAGSDNPFAPHATT